jgi:hypothetical protein
MERIAGGVGAVDEVVGRELAERPDAPPSPWPPGRLVEGSRRTLSPAASSTRAFAEGVASQAFGSPDAFVRAAGRRSAALSGLAEDAREELSG